MFSFYFPLGEVGGNCLSKTSYRSYLKLHLSYFKQYQIYLKQYHIWSGTVFCLFEKKRKRISKLLLNTVTQLKKKLKKSYHGNLTIFFVPLKKKLFALYKNNSTAIVSQKEKNKSLLKTGSYFADDDKKNVKMFNDYLIIMFNKGAATCILHTK